jgi:hypothetical protein
LRVQVHKPVTCALSSAIDSQNAHWAKCTAG